MPLYEFRCRRCAREWEEIRTISAPDPPPCPGCGSKDAERLISRTSFVLRGKGWAKDGYSEPPPRKEPGA